MAIEAIGENAEQIRYWNEAAGPRWVAFQDAIDRQIAPLGRLAMERVGIGRGDRVLDVGCGCGHTTLEIARRVGPDGSVLGVDLSSGMLEQLSAGVRAAGLANVRATNADARSHAFPAASFDVAYSRFGVMFFADPDAAFANLRPALRPGGRLGFVCWQALPKNPWMLVPLMAAAQVIPLPPPPPPGAPGPFSFADPERVRGILARAGFEEVSVEPHEETLAVGGSSELDRVVEFILQVGPTGSVLKDADAGTKNRVAETVREALRPHLGPEDLRMGSAVWIVTARRP